MKNYPVIYPLFFVLLGAFLIIIIYGVPGRNEQKYVNEGADREEQKLVKESEAGNEQNTLTEDPVNYEQQLVNENLNKDKPEPPNEVTGSNNHEAINQSEANREQKSLNEGTNLNNEQNSHMSGVALFGQALFTRGSPWFQNYGNTLYVAVCEPQFGGGGNFQSCKVQYTTKLGNFQNYYGMLKADWRIDKLKEGTTYMVYIFTDKNGDGESDIKGLVTQGEGPRSSDLIYDPYKIPPYDGMALTFDPPYPPDY